MTTTLLESYRNATYEVLLPGGKVRLVVDQHCPALEEWFREKRFASAVLLTACNPQGQQQADSLNQSAQQRLEQRLSAAGYHLKNGIALDPAGVWPPERGFLVPGMSLADAHSVASEFRQLAFLWCGGDAIPRLMETGQPAR